MAHASHSLVRRISVGVFLLLAFIWSFHPLYYVGVSVLIVGYAYLYRREIGGHWLALTVAMLGFSLLVLGAYLTRELF